MIKPIIQAPPKVDFAFAAKDLIVTDGDTFKAWVDLGFSTWRSEKFRLAHINAPEKNTAAGPLSTAFLVQWIAGQKSFVLHSAGQDKYGRWLATLWGDDRAKPVNQAMLDLGLAVPYM